MNTELQSSLNFDGATFDKALDAARLAGQLEYVRVLMSDEKWRTLRDIAGDKYSEAGISARLRDLRKARCGGLTVDRRRITGGLFEYRVTKGER